MRACVQNRAAGGHDGLDLFGIGGQGSIASTQVPRDPESVTCGVPQLGHRTRRLQQTSGVGGDQIPFPTTRNEVMRQRVQSLSSTVRVVAETWAGR